MSCVSMEASLAHKSLTSLSQVSPHHAMFWPHAGVSRRVPFEREQSRLCDGQNSKRKLAS